MKKIKVNIAERLYLLGILNQFKGDHRTLALVLQDIVPIGFTNKERDEVNLRDVKKEGTDEIVSIAWDETSEIKNKEVELHEEVVDYLKQVIEQKSKDGAFTIGDRPIVTLVEKLNL